jgi:hypothetical protein
VKLGSIDIALSVYETHSFIQAVSTPFPVLRVPARARWLTLPSPVLGDVCVLTCMKVEVVGEDGKTGANQERDRTWVSPSDRQFIHRIFKLQTGNWYSRAEANVSHWDVHRSIQGRTIL